MNTTSPAVRWLSIVLSLVALHSASVGLVMIVAPLPLMEAFGFGPIAEPFFKAQGGVFHILMAVAYALAALDPLGRRVMVVFTITVKLTATVFLVVYYVVVSSMPFLLASAAGDFLMGLVPLLLFRTVTRRSAGSG